MVFAKAGCGRKHRGSVSPRSSSPANAAVGGNTGKARSIPASAPPAKSIFAELKLAIMQGKYKPRERLTERGLAAKFGVSRIPVREALRKLESLGMVHIHSYQGAHVADFSPQEIDSLYLVRLHLETLAGKLACNGTTPHDIRRLDDLNDRLKEAIAQDDFSRMIEFDQQFHLALMECSQNPFLVKTIEDLRLRSYPVSYLFWRRKKHLRKSIREHQKMIAALRRKDGEELSALTEKQLSNSKKSYLEFLSFIQ